MCNVVHEFSSLPGCLCCVSLNMINSEQHCSSFKDLNSSCSFHVCLGLYSGIQKITPPFCLLWCWQAPFQHCVCTSFTFLEKSFHDKQIPSEAVVWPRRGCPLLLEETVHLRRSAFSPVPCTAPYRTGVAIPQHCGCFPWIYHYKEWQGCFFLKQKLGEALVHAQQYSLEVGFQCVVAAEKLSLSLWKPADAHGLPACPDRDVQWHLQVPALTFMRRLKHMLPATMTGFFWSLALGWTRVIYLILAVWVGLT